MCISRLINKYREYNHNYIFNRTKYKFVPELYTPTSYYMFNLLNDIKVLTSDELREAMKHQYFDAYLFLKISGSVYRQCILSVIIVNNRLDLYLELKKKYPGLIHDLFYDYDNPIELFNYDKSKYKEFIDNI